MPLSVRRFVLGLGLLLAIPTGIYAADSVGVPVQLTITPTTLRQGPKAESTFVATVVLKEAAPKVFVCQVRSSDRNKVSFRDIVFKKGDLQGTTTGTVRWNRVFTDCHVQTSAFNVDSPGDKVWSTISLKIADVPPPNKTANP